MRWQNAYTIQRVCLVQKSHHHHNRFKLKL